jgi:hypothetical protein
MHDIGRTQLEQQSFGEFEGEQFAGGEFEIGEFEELEGETGEYGEYGESAGFEVPAELESPLGEMQ